MDLLDAIGNTSLVRLRKVVPPQRATILARLEWENPTGSMKNWMARAVIERTERDGRLKPGDTVVKYTGGSTGMPLALVCAARPGHARAAGRGRLPRRNCARAVSGPPIGPTDSP